MIELKREKVKEVLPHMEAMIRHLAINSLRSINVKFRKKYGQMILSNDARGLTWRKEVFPYYKGKRKKARDKDSLDWASLYAMINTIKGEIQEFFPYPYLEVPGAESDDIIGVLCSRTDEETMIVSSDSDFIQLQSRPNISQYSPLFHKQVKPKTGSAREDLLVKILKGDSGDGIPNILSKDKVFLTDGERQKSVSKKMLAEWIDNITMMPGYEFSDPETQSRYRRNRQLIDLAYTPEAVVEKILYNHESQIARTADMNRSGIYEYLKINRMRLLLDALTDF